MNYDGTADTSYAMTGTDVNALTLTVQSNQKVIITGYYYSFSGASYRNTYIRRLMPDGSTDSSFTVHEHMNDLNALNLLPYLKTLADDSILFSERSMRMIDGHTVKKIIHLDPDGDLDPDFDKPCQGFVGYQVSALDQQADGKLLLAGEFFSYNGVETHPD